MAVNLMTVKKGFTLVELVIIIIVIGILAVTAIPRLLTTSDYAQRSVQDQIISQIRLTQLRALNDRSGCYAVYIGADSQGIYRVNRNVDSSCPASYTLQEQSETSDKVVIDINGELATNADPLKILFDTKGRPANSADCSAGNQCKIDITAKQSTSVCIESEGYVHGC